MVNFKDDILPENVKEMLPIVKTSILAIIALTLFISFFNGRNLQKQSPSVKLPAHQTPSFMIKMQFTLISSPDEFLTALQNHRIR